jgi:hypothetical protein
VRPQKIIEPLAEQIDPPSGAPPGDIAILPAPERVSIERDTPPERVRVGGGPFEEVTVLGRDKILQERVPASGQLILEGKRSHLRATRTAAAGDERRRRADPRTRWITTRTGIESPKLRLPGVTQRFQPSAIGTINNLAGRPAVGPGRPGADQECARAGKPVIDRLTLSWPRAFLDET